MQLFGTPEIWPKLNSEEKKPKLKKEPQKAPLQFGTSHMGDTAKKEIWSEDSKMQLFVLYEHPNSTAKLCGRIVQW